MNSTPRLGKVQLQIMQVLWARERATAREITDDLNRQKSVGAAPIAHSTTQTLLRKLEAKGAIKHRIEERTFVFEPLHERSEVETGVVGDLLARLFDRSISGLVAHLVKHEKVSPQELQRLRTIVEQAEAAQNGQSSQKEAP